MTTSQTTIGSMPTPDEKLLLTRRTALGCKLRGRCEEMTDATEHARGDAHIAGW